MTRKSLNRLLAATALSAPVALVGLTPAAAQDNSCTQLEQLLEQDLPEGLTQTEEELNRILEEGDPEQCRLVSVEIEGQGGQQEEQQAQETEEVEGELAETEQARIQIEDEVVVEGEVFIEQQPPQVDIESGETEVTVQEANPSVTVNEQPAEIMVRQAPATIRVEMPQPTITIEQAAPEIIVTMPPPGVDVGDARPQVEVRQAEPTVRVMQTNPTVDMQITQAEDPEATEGVQVRDRASGETMAQGEQVEASEAQVNVTSGEPVVTYQEAEGEPQVEVTRAEPTVQYESAEPSVEFTSEGEPQIEFIQAGEPTVTFQEAANESEAEAEGEQMQAAQLAEEGEEQPEADAGGELVAGAEPPESAEAEVEPMPEAEIDAAEGEMQPAEETDAAEAGGEMQPTEEPDAAEAGGELQPVEETEVETEMAAAGPEVEREGFQMVQVNEVDAERLTGATVYDVNDENVGDVGDLLLSADGQVEDAIIDVGGFLGLGEKQVRVPFSDLSMLRNPETDELRIYVASTEEELESMPEYTE
jgi:hypothetical protein